MSKPAASCAWANSTTNAGNISPSMTSSVDFPLGWRDAYHTNDAGGHGYLPMKRWE